MNVKLIRILITTRKSIEEISFTDAVTFLYGPVGTGKSSVARLVDFCLGGRLERTPAIQNEFLSATLELMLGDNFCVIERGSQDNHSVRVTWRAPNDSVESLNAPFAQGSEALIGKDIFNFSDLLFHLCNVEPIKVLKRRSDPDSPYIRLGFRDIWRFCYLDQAHLDSSFYRMEDPIRGRKSQDAMRFFTGLHSDRFSQLHADLAEAISEQHVARESVARIREFMKQFDLGNEADIAKRIQDTSVALDSALESKSRLESERVSKLHPTDSLRGELRTLSTQIADLQESMYSLDSLIIEQESLRAELISTKIKAERADQAGKVLEKVNYVMCPQCGTDIKDRPIAVDHCGLCGEATTASTKVSSVNSEAIRRELADRIDQIDDSISRRRLALEHSERLLAQAEQRKSELDMRLQHELALYDSAYIESIREVDRQIATLNERMNMLLQLQEMPLAITLLEQRAGATQGQIDVLRTALADERGRMRSADHNARRIGDEFKRVLLRTSFPGLSVDDEVQLDTRTWRPVISHEGIEWGFWDTGSGGKKTLFNVCFALALHAVAVEAGLPVPNILIIDSPTKNISDSENPELVESLYSEIYRMAADYYDDGLQFFLIDSDCVEPTVDLMAFSKRRLAGTDDEPRLISYYSGP